MGVTRRIVELQSFKKFQSLVYSFGDSWYDVYMNSQVYRFEDGDGVQEATQKDVQEPVQDGDLVSGESALAMLGIDLEEALEVDAELRQTVGERSREICVCGHPMSRHTVVNGIVFCKPSRMECPCKKARPVLEAEDMRAFLRKTAGSGPMHALTRGIAASAQKTKKVRWTIDLNCDRCGKATGKVIPTPVTQSGIAVSYATGYDALLCADCREKI